MAKVLEYMIGIKFRNIGWKRKAWIMKSIKHLHLTSPSWYWSWISKIVDVVRQHRCYFYIYRCLISTSWIWMDTSSCLFTICSANKDVHICVYNFDQIRFINIYAQIRKGYRKKTVKSLVFYQMNFTLYHKEVGIYLLNF